MTQESRLTKLETLIATRHGDHPTVMRLELRHQRFLVDLGDSGGIIPDVFWKPLDSGEAGTPARAAFDLCLEYSEEKIWQQADRLGLRAELENLLGRGPLTADELATAEAEFFYPLTSEEFSRNWAEVGRATASHR